MSKNIELLYDSYIIKELKRLNNVHITKKMISDKRTHLLHYRKMKAINFDFNDNRKYCWRCKKLYLNKLENFAKVISRKTYDGLESNCKKCKKEKRKIDYDKHKDNYVKKACEWQRENKNKRSLICKKNYKKYKDCPKHNLMKKNIKIKYHKTEKGKKQIFIDGLRGLLRHGLNVYGNGKKMTSKKYGINYESCYKKLYNEAKKMGYTIQELRNMKFHIDHIIPTSLYNFKTHNDIKNCFNPLNLRWLPAKENIIKGNRIRPQDLEIIKTLPISIYPKGFDINNYKEK